TGAVVVFEHVVVHRHPVGGHVVCLVRVDVHFLLDRRAEDVHPHEADMSYASCGWTSSARRSSRKRTSYFTFCTFISSASMSVFSRQVLRIRSAMSASSRISKTSSSPMPFSRARPSRSSKIPLAANLADSVTVIMTFIMTSSGTLPSSRTAWAVSLLNLSSVESKKMRFSDSFLMALSIKSFRLNMKYLFPGK